MLKEHCSEMTFNNVMKCPIKKQTVIVTHSLHPGLHWFLVPSLHLPMFTTWDRCALILGKVEASLSVLKNGSRVWLKPRCSYRTCSRESFLPHRQLTERKGRLPGRPLGVLLSLQWEYSPDISRIEHTMCSSGGEAGLLGDWWISDKSW
jgi:hypothetical protein